MYYIGNTKATPFILLMDCNVPFATVGHVTYFLLKLELSSFWRSIFYQDWDERINANQYVRFQAYLKRTCSPGRLKLEGFVWKEQALPFSHALLLFLRSPCKFLYFQNAIEPFPCALLKLIKLNIYQILF